MSITEGKIGGTSSKDHNMELSASYDVDDHSLLSAYARIFCVTICIRLPVMMFR